MKRSLFLAVLLLSFVMAATVYAANGYPWSSHAAPYDFLFENHIDTHQQSKLNDRDKLGGFFYIKYTGNEVDGVPEAEHADCDLKPDQCLAGWKLKGVKFQATLFDKPSMEHPLWCVNAEDLPRSPDYSHFHWLGDPEHAGDLQIGETYDGYLLKLTAQDRFFFKHHGGFLVNPGVDTETHANVRTNCPSESN
jgi:hypothetical protein